MLRLAQIFPLLCAVLFLSGCSEYVNRDYFASQKGLGISDPTPDKDGTWWIRIEYKDDPVNSAKQVVGWDARALSRKIIIRAKVSLIQKGRKPAAGASIEKLIPGTYEVKYENLDGTLIHLTTVSADYGKEPGIHWAGGK